MLRRLWFAAVRLFVNTKWFLLGDYYARLAVQARYLYRQSQLFKDRWLEVNLDYAETSFDNVAEHFFYKAKKDHILIRGRILLDSVLGRPPQPYAIRDDSIV